MTKNDRTRRLRSFMTESFRLDFSISRINDSNLLVLARCDELRSVPIEACTEHDIGMTVDLDEHFASADVPNHHLIVRAGREQDIQCGWMPKNETDSSLMIEQVDDRFGECSRKAAVGNLPHLEFGSISMWLVRWHGQVVIRMRRKYGQPSVKMKIAHPIIAHITSSPSNGHTRTVREEKRCGWLRKCPRLDIL